MLLRCAGKFSPFHGFCRMMSQHANVKDGGTSVHGVSRAGLNKLLGAYFHEGMRKPSRNGNPGDLDSPCASKLARHFLKVRWRDPDETEDRMVLQQMFAAMQPHEVFNCIAVLREFTKWRPGPAGRGGDRASVRTASDAGVDAIDEVLRTVRQRIETGGKPDGCCPVSADDEDDEDEDDRDDDMSMRSTVVNAPATCAHRPLSVPSPPSAPSPRQPVDNVEAMQSLIDDIRSRSLGSSTQGAAGPAGGIPAPTGGACGARSSHAWASAGGSTDLSSSAAGASSADLLESLFRQVASQQLNPAASRPLSSLSQSVVQPSHPPLQCSSKLARGEVPDIHLRWTPPPLQASSSRGSPEDTDVGSSSRIQQLCDLAVAACGDCGDDKVSRGGRLPDVHVPDSSLTLPPLRLVLSKVGVF